MNTELIHRLEQSIQFLKDNLTFTVGEFVIGKSENGRIFVNAYTHYLTVENIDQNKIESELYDIELRFIQLMNKSEIFKEYIKPFGIDFYLLLDTGTAGITICGKVEGNYKIFID
jgi:hypothetical protein